VSLRNAGARVGDVLILTKPIGTGVLATALKNGQLSEEKTRALVSTMTLLNREASEYMLLHEPHACTDITGFGLIGHANEMAEGSDVTIVIKSGHVPLLEGARECVERGFVPGGTKSTQKFLAPRISIAPSVDATTQALLFDAQTSGGLLIAVAPHHAAPLLAQLKPNHPRPPSSVKCAAPRRAHRGGVAHWFLQYGAITCTPMVSSAARRLWPPHNRRRFAMSMGPSLANGLM
jgi:selenophosphate synthase